MTSSKQRREKKLMGKMTHTALELGAEFLRTRLELPHGQAVFIPPRAAVLKPDLPIEMFDDAPPLVELPRGFRALRKV